MALLEQVCGYKDLNGKFHDTMEQTEIENEKIIKYNLKETILNEFLDSTNKQRFGIVTYDKNGLGEYYGDLVDFLWKYSSEIFKAVIAIIRYKFKEKWNETGIKKS